MSKFLLRLAEASLMGIYGKKKCGSFRKVWRESFRKSFTESFYRKVLSESFSESFLESFTGKFYEKSFTGETGNQVWIETWKVVDPSQLQ